MIASAVTVTVHVIAPPERAVTVTPLVQEATTLELALALLAPLVIIFGLFVIVEGAITLAAAAIERSTWGLGDGTLSSDHDADDNMLSGQGDSPDE